MNLRIISMVPKNIKRHRMIIPAKEKNGISKTDIIKGI